MSTIEEVGAKIRASIRAARKEGFAIKPNILRRKTERACCAVGAVVRNVPHDEPGWAAARKELDVPQSALIDIARGFDGEVLFYEKEWYDLGAELREEVAIGVL
jgi:hypothetical protein